MIGCSRRGNAPGTRLPQGQRRSCTGWGEPSCSDCRIYPEVDPAEALQTADPASFGIRSLSFILGESALNSMRNFAETCEAIAATTKKLRKTAIVADYLKLRTIDEGAISAVFLSGKAFPAWEETTLQVGGALLSRVVADLSGKDEAALTAAYRKHGDLGAVAGELLPERSGQGLGVLEVGKMLREIAAARGPAAKSALVRDLLAR